MKGHSYTFTDIVRYLTSPLTRVASREEEEEATLQPSNLFGVSKRVGIARNELSKDERITCLPYRVESKWSTKTSLSNQSMGMFQ